jgi:PadR family transcriptional regulator, regulatory protein PadR
VKKIEIDLQNWETQLRKGLLEIAILNVLRNGRSHGYEIVRLLKQVEGFELREGNIYPILARLQADDLVVSEVEPSQDGPPRKYFVLTMQGKKALAGMNAHWDILAASIAQIRKGAEK